MKELRIGLVLYGGVSLAIYMNGVVNEIWNALRASEVRASKKQFVTKGSVAVYHRLMKDLALRGPNHDLRIVVDTIAGSSAGGVNGVALGKAIATGADITILKETWIEKAGIGRLAAPAAHPAPWWFRLSGNVLAVVSPDFRRVRRTLNKTPGIGWKWARDHIYSLFYSDDPEKTLLRGNYFTKMIASALEDMTHGSSGPNLLPPGGRLDLVLTSTDLYGWPRHLPVDPRFHDKLWETAHAHQMHFRFSRPPSSAFRSSGNDFDEDFALTYAARATAGFPMAFAPASYRTVRKSFTKARYGHPIPDKHIFAARHLPEHHLAAYKASKVWMIDGGILDNKPFSAAIRLIEEKPANRAVYRTLMYVEPDPALAEFSKTASMPLPIKMPSLLYKLFRHEPIFADLQAVAARNRFVKRLIAVADAAKDHGEHIMGADIAKIPIAKIPIDLARLRAKANKQLREGNNPSYPGYTMLKVRRAADTLAGSISEALGYPHESKHGYFLRQVIRNFLRQEGAFNSPEFDIEKGFYRSNPQLTILLRAFDVPYRLRRLRYLVYVANDRYNDSRITAASIDAFKGELMQSVFAFDELTEYVRGHGEAIRVRLEEAIGNYNSEANNLGVDDLEAQMGSYTGELAHSEENELSKFVRDHLSDIHLLYRALRIHFVRTMRCQGRNIRRAISNLPPLLYEPIARAYVVYPMIDAAIFPMMDSAGVHDLSTIHVFRISPHDAKALSRNRHRLESRRLEGFAGFLRRDIREHDLLWGRLDGTERMIDLIVAAACGPPRTWSNAIQSRRTAALNAAIDAILDEAEEGASRHLRRVIMRLRNRMPI